jgi:hypothetical protein
MHGWINLRTFDQKTFDQILVKFFLSFDTKSAADLATP